MNLKSRLEKAMILVLLFSFFTFFVACSAKKDISKMTLQDGVFQGVYQDEESDDPSRVEVEITIENGKITACKSTEYGGNGKPKGEEYAAISPEAKKAVEGLVLYPDLLIQTQDPEAIDAVSGATTSLKRFQKAVWDALEKASE